MTESNAPCAFSDWPGSAPWQPLPVAALHSFLISHLLGGGLVGLIIGATLPLLVMIEFPSGGALLGLGLAGLLIGLLLGAWQARLRWRYTRWRLDDDGLRLRRGRYWRSEILVPRARVQHLDIERGPIERHFGLATLALSTAGTRLGAVRQAGFAAADATALRDALVPRSREHDDRAEETEAGDRAIGPGDASP